MSTDTSNLINTRKSIKWTEFISIGLSTLNRVISACQVLATDQIKSAIQTIKQITFMELDV